MDAQPPNLQPNPQPNLPLFWEHQLSQIQQTTAFKGHQELPLTRIQRIVRSSGELKSVSSEVAALLSKAGELLIMEMTLRSWGANSTTTTDTSLCSRDIAHTINTTNHLGFLSRRVPIEVVPRDAVVHGSISLNKPPRVVRGALDRRVHPEVAHRRPFDHRQVAQRILFGRPHPRQRHLGGLPRNSHP